LIAFDAAPFPRRGGSTSADRTAIVAMREGLTIALTALGGAAIGLANQTQLRVLGWSENVHAGGGGQFEPERNPRVPHSLTRFILDSAFYGILDTNRLGM